MNTLNAQRSPLPWWAAGVLLGLVQVLAVSLVGPLEVSTQFVVADAKALEHVAPEYAENHPLVSSKEYRQSGYGWWFNIGIVLGALIAVLHLRTWRVRTTTVWLQRNHNAPVLLRLIVGFCGGVFLLLGAGLAHGALSGQLISGWTQLSLSAVPFTITMFGCGMLVAYLVYPRGAGEDRRGR
ncbi:MAG: YeeE/YedE thiosulfate transporter family protein [Planctomycetota bacterium]